MVYNSVAFSKSRIVQLSPLSVRHFHNPKKTALACKTDFKVKITKVEVIG